MGLKQHEAAIFDRQDFPLTDPRSPTQSIQEWAQREYVECMRQGASFSGGSTRWTYHHGQPWAWSMDAPNPGAVMARRNKS